MIIGDTIFDIIGWIFIIAVGISIYQGLIFFFPICAANKIITGSIVAMTLLFLTRN